MPKGKEIVEIRKRLRSDQRRPDGELSTVGTAHPIRQRADSVAGGPASDSGLWPGARRPIAGLLSTPLIVPIVSFSKSHSDLPLSFSRSDYPRRYS